MIGAGDIIPSADVVVPVAGAIVPSAAVVISHIVLFCNLVLFIKLLVSYLIFRKIVYKWFEISSRILISTTEIKIYQKNLSQ